MQFHPLPGFVILTMEDEPKEILWRPLMSTAVQDKDSKVTSVFRWKGILDLVDTQWMCDSLSDDGVEIPEELDLNLEDEMAMRPDVPSIQSEAPERWNDLGLDLFGQSQS
ncbi:unnamed protein product [Aphanomyces euteiches]|nr:hypothetical protein AeRB84_020633 [Aphanomyces euteiches]